MSPIVSNLSFMSYYHLSFLNPIYHPIVIQRWVNI